MDSIEEISQALKDLDIKIWVAVIGAVTAAFGSILSAWISYKNTKNQTAEKRKEEKLKKITKELEEFYGPLQQYLNNSKVLFKILASDKPKEFRLLTFLLKPDQTYQLEDRSMGKVVLNQTDKIIIEEILALGLKMEELIITKAGLVEDVELRVDYKPDASVTDVTLEGNGLLAFTLAHFQIIRLAYTGKISGEVEKFENYVFPRELPIKIEKKINDLQREIERLSV